MTPNTRKLIIPALALIVLSSCNLQKPKTSEDTLTRLSRSDRTNYVDTMTLRLTDFRRQIISNGKLEAVRKSQLRFGSSGVISEILYSNGQSVRKGELIASLNDEEATIAMDRAQHTLRRAEIDMNDALIGFGYGGSDTDIPEEVAAIVRTRSGYTEAELSYRKAQLEYNGTKITAPFSGKVADISARVYENAPSDVFCSVIDDSSFEVVFPLLESEISSVKLGLPVQISPFNDPDKSFTGEITAINPTVDSKGQIQVTASVKNKDHRMMDGMNVKVLVEEIIPHRQVVPKSAVVMRDNMEVLFVYQPADSSTRWVYVDILMSNSDSHVVTANKDRNARLDLGDIIVTSGNLNLAHESKVTVRP